jgi:acetylornithine deacetylase/succinyl-diaminopimelate desuccinylase family protein
LAPPACSSLVELVAGMVRIDSTNAGPAGADVPSPREAEISAFVNDWLEDRGIWAERREFAPGRFNVIGAVPGSGRRRLLIDAHMDTVPVEAMEIDPFSGEIKDGRIYGRGACDDKGSLGAAMWGLVSLAESGRKPAATIELLASGDEEGGFGGIKDWVAQGGGADAAIVGEATELRLVTASRGALRFKVRTRGKAAHTCTPEMGVNAITHMCQVIGAIETDLKPRLFAREHPLLGSPRITVSMIHGGRRANIVPDECEIDIDRRVLPDETEESAAAEFDQMLHALRRADESLVVERDEPYGFQPAAECPGGSDIAAIGAEAIAAEGLPIEPHGVPYTTHASVTAAAGIPTISIGPGSIEQAHSTVEWIEVAQVEAAARIYQRIFETYGRDDG